MCCSTNTNDDEKLVNGRNFYVLSNLNFLERKDQGLFQNLFLSINYFSGVEKRLLEM